MPLPTPMQSMTARNPLTVDPKTGLPQDFFALMSKMAVDEAAQHWQTQQALSTGQTPPTVADTAGKQAEAFMQQKMVEQFAKRAAQHPTGLPGAQSNLPTSYAGGGIVAFQNRGYVDPEMFGTDAMRGISSGAQERPDPAGSSWYQDLLDALEEKDRQLNGRLWKMGSDTPEAVQNLPSSAARLAHQGAGYTASVDTSTTDTSPQAYSSDTAEQVANTRKAFTTMMHRVEGGWNPDDGIVNGVPSVANFGLNSVHNPEIGDVRTLTQDQADLILTHKYYDDIGGDARAARDPAYALMLADAAVNQGGSWAKAADAKAKGDLKTLRDLRTEAYQSPKNRNTGWKNRMDIVEDVIAKGGFPPTVTNAYPETSGSRRPAPQQPDAPPTQVYGPPTPPQEPQRPVDPFRDELREAIRQDRALNPEDQRRNSDRYNMERYGTKASEIEKEYMSGLMAAKARMDEERSPGRALLRDIAAGFSVKDKDGRTDIADVLSGYLKATDARTAREQSEDLAMGKERYLAGMQGVGVGEKIAASGNAYYKDAEIAKRAATGAGATMSNADELRQANALKAQDQLHTQQEAQADRKEQARVNAQAKLQEANRREAADIDRQATAVARQNAAEILRAYEKNEVINKAKGILPPDINILMEQEKEKLLSTHKRYQEITGGAYTPADMGSRITPEYRNFFNSMAALK